jgi:hypothetical protein
MPEKKRQLNMEEKRHLQKLVFSDIHAAEEEYRNARREEREKLQERLVQKAPGNVIDLFAEYQRSTTAITRVEKELLSLGYSIARYPETRLTIAYNKPPEELVEFDSETSRTDKSISDLKRDYTLRLFAGGEEAKQLFATLANELAKIAH